MYLSLSLRWPSPLAITSQDSNALLANPPIQSAFTTPVPTRLYSTMSSYEHSPCPYRHRVPHPHFSASISSPFMLHAEDTDRGLLPTHMSEWARIRPHINERIFSQHDPLKSTFLRSQEILAAAKVGFVQRLPLLAKSSRLEMNNPYSFDKKLFTCVHCRYVTDRKNNLKRHVATMHQNCDKALECCGVSFGNKASLRDHVMIFHSSGYMCRFCGRNFCRKALLKRHLTVHSGRKDYVCEICEYATSHKSNLERHRRIHERQDTENTDEHTEHSARQDTENTDGHTGHSARQDSTNTVECTGHLVSGELLVKNEKIGDKILLDENSSPPRSDHPNVSPFVHSSKGVSLNELSDTAINNAFELSESFSAPSVDIVDVES